MNCPPSGCVSASSSAMPMARHHRRQMIHVEPLHVERFVPIGLEFAADDFGQETRARHLHLIAIGIGVKRIARCTRRSIASRGSASRSLHTFHARPCPREFRPVPSARRECPTTDCLRAGPTARAADRRRSRRPRPSRSSGAVPTSCAQFRHHSCCCGIADAQADRNRRRSSLRTIAHHRRIPGRQAIGRLIQIEEALMYDLRFDRSARWPPAMRHSSATVNCCTSSPLG